VAERRVLPVLDDLAGRRTRFLDAFVTTPIYAASRASIFTGTRERRLACTFGTPPLDPELLTRVRAHCDELAGSLEVSDQEPGPHDRLAEGRPTSPGEDVGQRDPAVDGRQLERRALVATAALTGPGELHVLIPRPAPVKMNPMTRFR